MLAYTLRRFVGAWPTLLVLVTLSFFMVRAAPGGPFDVEKNLPPEIEANLAAKYHLDEPLWRQYLRYLGDLAQGDLGPSFKYADYTVNELIAQGFPVSLRLGLAAMALALLIGLPAGMLAGLRQNRPTDHVTMALAMTGISVPGFVVAPLLILVFAVGPGWVPAGGLDGGIRSWILPVVALALPLLAYIARLTRASLIEVWRSPFIRTARAKGLPLRLILLRHALKPTLLPLVSFLGPALAGVITGSVVIEAIFGIPGLGRYFVQGALNRDYTLVMGVVVFYGALIIAFNFLVDLLYALLDPRVRYS
ncbi:MAG: oligopeptide ABC transporter permease OppB [Pseudomonadota bacterium]